MLNHISEPIFFITNDVVHGLGLEKILPNYHLICIDDHPLVGYLEKEGVSVFCLEKELGKKNIVYRNSGKLLELPLTEQFIEKNSRGQTPWIMYFKPSPKIDRICQQRGYKQIGNSSKLNQAFEDKLSFYNLCVNQRWPVPPGEIVEFFQADYSRLQQKYGSELVIQFGRGWAGSTTFFIESLDQFEELKDKVGQRKVKIAKFVHGETFLNNACIFDDRVLVGPPAIQLTGLEGLTSKSGGTCGRIWPASINAEEEKIMTSLTLEVGHEIKKSGYRGFLGIDFLRDQKSGKILLSEVNARLTASSPFYTKLELGLGKTPLLAYHIASFLGKDLPVTDEQTVVVGSEVVVRNNSSESVTVTKKFRPGIYRLDGDQFRFVKEAYDVQGSENDEFFLTAASQGRVIDSEIELIRLDSYQSLLDDHNKLDSAVVKNLLKLKQDLLA